MSEVQNQFSLTHAALSGRISAPPRVVNILGVPGP
jgi:hypothetical protein